MTPLRAVWAATARGRAWALFAAAVAINLYVLFVPGGADTGSSVPHRDKIVHLVVFAAVAWTGRRAAIAGAVLAAVLLAHAVVSEVVQHFLVAGRSGDPWDVVADLAGVAVGLALPVGQHARARRGPCAIMGR